MGRSFLTVMKVVLNYLRAFYMKYGVSFAETCSKDIFNDMTSTRYQPKQWHSLFVWDVKFSHLMTKNADLLQLLESLNEGQEEGKELKKSHSDSKLVHAT